MASWVSGQIKISDLIKALEKLDTSMALSVDNAEHIRVGTNIGSYRGYYEDIAIDYETAGSRAYVVDLVHSLKSALGKTFHGYKGGAYRCHDERPVWLANYGHSTGVALTGVVERDGEAVLTWTLDDLYTEPSW